MLSWFSAKKDGPEAVVRNLRPPVCVEDSCQKMNRAPTTTIRAVVPPFSDVILP